MSGIQWTKAAWGGPSPGLREFPRAFSLAMPAAPLVDRTGVARAALGGRTRLWELSGMLHCSVVGTCLTTAELRQVLHKLGLAQPGTSDHAAHKIGVTIAGRHDAAGKRLHKLLDERHRAAITRFARADSRDAVRTLWTEALASADIPGAYWAGLTHPAADHTLVGDMFGDVHMLSHLVGAANRADIRRLRDLERESAELRERLARQQARLRDEIVSRDAAIADLRAALAAPGAARPHAGAEVAALRALAADLERRLAAEAARRAATDQKLATARAELQRERAARAAAERDAAAAHADLDALERHLPMGETAEIALPDLGGMTILYVGGRPGLQATLRGLAERLNITLLQHDGGVEDNDGTLARLIGRAGMVLFPADCVSHRAAGVVKRGCERGGKDFVVLRSASASAFLACMARVRVKAVWIKTA